MGLTMAGHVTAHRRGLDVPDELRERLSLGARGLPATPGAARGAGGDRPADGMMRREARSLLAPVWRVTVAEHEVPPRWQVERQVVKVCAHDESEARMSTARAAQLVAEVPPMRSLRAVTYCHTTATPLGSDDHAGADRGCRGPTAGRGLLLGRRLGGGAGGGRRVRSGSNKLAVEIARLEGA